MNALITSIVTWILIALAATAVSAAEIAVLMSSDAAIYQEALQGFREAAPNRSIKVFMLPKSAEQRNALLHIVRSVSEPNLLLVLGTPALEAVMGKITTIPIIHAMVFNPPLGTITEGKNITGVSMIPGADKTISLIKELNPKIRRVGVMRDPTWHSSLFWQAQSAALNQDIQLVDAKIRSVGDIAAALKSFDNKIDLLWLWPDERFLGDDVLERIFLFSFESKVPVLGLSERHTKMGALLSFSYGSAKDLGKQAGELMLKTFHSSGHSLPGAVRPRQSKLTVNLKTARKLDFDVPDSVIRKADNGIKAPIYRDGDWWIFRTKGPNPMGGTQIEEHLVTYRNGDFETEYPSFLNGGDYPSGQTFLPFASLYFKDPERRWLDFPLLPGKSWSFRYMWHSTASSIFRGGMANATAEVVGNAPELIQIPAGKFSAIQINRHDELNGNGYLTYFYSPDTKSIVTLTATVRTQQGASQWSSTRRFELELVSYGHGSKK